MRNFFTLPNLLSLARIALGAAAMLAITAGSLSLAAVLIVTGALTAIATRCLKTPADPGKSLDATCDAIFQLAVFLAFLIKGWMPLWAALCVYSCEIALPYLRSFARQFEAQRSPRTFEKIKSATFWTSLLAAALIELHDAAFHIESTPNVGTKVWAEFPVTRVASVARMAA